MRRFSWPVSAGVVVVAALIGGVSGVLASHSFSDVPSGHPFHDEISAVAGAGIARGFMDGTYHPSDAVTRQAMAAFLERGVGRAGAGSGTVVLAEGQTDVVAEVTIEAGAAGSGTGFVVVHGHATASTEVPAGCPCPVHMAIEGSTNTAAFDVPSTTNPNGPVQNAGSVSGVFAITTDAARTFRLVVTLGEQAGGGASLSVRAHVVAIYVPLAADGDDSLTLTLSCPPDDGYEQNDDRSQATSHYSYAPTTSRAIACPGDEDWYALTTVTTDDSIKVQAAFTNAEGNIDVCVTNSSGDHTVCSTSTNNVENLTVTPTATGVYWVRVYLASDAGNPGNEYTLATSVNPL